MFTDPFYTAGNTLTQRIMGYQGGEVVAKVDISGMADGQFSGLALFHNRFCRIGVRQKNGRRTIEFNQNQTATVGPVVTQNDLWFKAVIDKDFPPKATFYYSLDGQKFISIGDPFTCGWANYRGTRIALYSFNAQQEAGFIDIDWMHYDYPISDTAQVH